MHTLFEIPCDTCGGELVFSKSNTLEEFILDVNYVKEEVTSILNKADKAYLVYQCLSCKRTTRYTLEDLFNLTHTQLLSDIKRARQRYVFKEIINLNSIDPDNGLCYCGICLGVDGEGNCYKDVITQCPFKR